MAVAVRVSVCRECGEEFNDPSRTAPRSYCDGCRDQRSSAKRRRLAVVESGRIAGDPFTVEHFCAWAGHVVLDTGEFWGVEPFFAAFLEDFFAGRVENWLLVPEANSKTTSMAGLALYHLEHVDYATALWAASARDQAEIGYLQAEGMVQRSDRLAALFKCHPGYRRIAHKSNGSRLQIFASDDRTGDGPIPTLCLLDELHRHRNMKLYRTWTGKMVKRGGQMAAFSTSGEPGSEFEEARLRLRDKADVVEVDGCFTRLASDRLVLHQWAVPEGADLEDMELVKLANPFSGITVDQLREKFESPTMTMPHWSRFVCNVPTRSAQSAITDAEWDVLAKPDAGIPEGERVWVGMDVAWKWDTTAIAPFWVSEDGRRVVGRVEILTPPRDGSMMRSQVIQDALERVHERNPIHTVVMDPHRAEQLAEWIEDELGCEVIERSQANQFRALDYSMWMEAIRLGVLEHDGDAEFRTHVLNAIARQVSDERFVFARPAENRGAVELQNRRVIDALDAAAMVHSTAMREEEVLDVPLLEVL